MIIDFHCHIILDLTDARLSNMAALFSRVGAACGVQKSEGDILSALAPLVNDPGGESLIQGMDHAGIDVSVCFPTDNMDVDDDAVLKAHRTCADLAQKYPGRIVLFASIDPRRGKAPDMLRRCVEELGVRGLKWHPDLGYSLTSEEAYRVLEVAQQAGLVLLTHTGPMSPPRRSKLCHPLVLDDVACDFPGIKIIAAHSGGLWQSDWVALAACNDHMYGDVATWQFEAVRNYQRFCLRLRDVIDTVGPGKLVFASDWPCFEAFLPVGDWLNMMGRLPMDSPAGVQFTAEEVDAILGENARKILGI